MHSFLSDKKSSLFKNKIAQIKNQVSNYNFKNKVHDYSQYIDGIDYVFESANSRNEWYLTSQGKVKKGDYIVFSQKNNSCQYKIKEVDYYQDSLDTFIALLVKS
jgi:hypothetical protein